MSTSPVTRIGHGVYRVERDGRADIVYVAGPASDRWAFWNGFIFRSDLASSSNGSHSHVRTRTVAPSLDAPMPATVVKVLVAAGATVKKGETVLVLEAMKMELPIRAPADAVVTAVHCRVGDLVQAGAKLIELDQSRTHGAS